MMKVKIPILLYHMICDSKGSPDERYLCSPRYFRLQMAYLKWAGYKVVSFDEVLSIIKKGGKINRKVIALTFDDGYKDNYEHSFPVLQKLGFPATIFVVSSYVGHSNEWIVQGGMPRREMASWDELREMSRNGIEIGSHTVSHISLAQADADLIALELTRSKKEIERQIGKSVRFFAYPYGHINDSAREAVLNAGYEAACSTRSGFNNTEVDPFILRRIEIYGSDSLWRFPLKVAWGTNDASLSLIMRYYFSRIQEHFRRWISAWT